MSKIFFVCIYVALSLLGVVLMKLGGNPGKIKLDKKDISVSMNLVSAIGWICYLGSFLLFTRIVVIFDLSYIMPLVTGIIQVLTLVFAKIVFKENLNIKAIIGAAFVIIGIFVMNFNI